MFADRQDAGSRLLERLPELDPEGTVVLALPRGGLPVADVIAKAIGAPLDIALVRKVGLPGHPELALAAVTDGEDPQITVNERVARSMGLTAADIRKLADRELPEIARRRTLYLRGRPPIPLAGKTVLVVDDGLATGATMLAALRVVRAAHASRIIVAVPVGPPDTLSRIERECDLVICLERPAGFQAVGQFYARFDQVSDDEVTAILEHHGAAQDAT